MDQPSLRVVSLGSGSSGNATVVTDGDTTILIDCGFSAREVARRMTACGLDPHRVSGLLVTHEHGDHVRGIDVFCRRHATDCTVYASIGTRRGARLYDTAFGVETIKPGESFGVGSLRVTPFVTSHDALQPTGFRVDAAACSFGLITDTGVLTEHAAETLAGCTLLGIESNHDVDMLENGPYPHYLKRRIASYQGHLSNKQAAEALQRLAHDSLAHVIGLHRSTTNNTERHAASSLTAALSRIGLSVPVTVASQSRPCEAGPNSRQGTLFE